MWLFQFFYFEKWRKNPYNSQIFHDFFIFWKKIRPKEKKKKNTKLTVWDCFFALWIWIHFSFVGTVACVCWKLPDLQDCLQRNFTCCWVIAPPAAANKGRFLASSWSSSCCFQPNGLKSAAKETDYTLGKQNKTKQNKQGQIYK